MARTLERRSAPSAPPPSTPACKIEPLLRQLVQSLDQVTSPRSPLDDEHCPGESILLDVQVDGARYVLVRAQAKASDHQSLSPREQEIVRMVAKGYPNKTIAAVLDISLWTVGTHLRRIFAKLNVGSRAAMVARVMEGAIVEDRPAAEGPEQARVSPSPATRSVAAVRRAPVPPPTRLPGPGRERVTSRAAVPAAGRSVAFG